MDRPSVLSDRPQKEFAIPSRSSGHLYDGEGPQGCFATDRILVDGCRVGYCYREEPEEGDENWDSGWRFTAGDESDSYMDDPAQRHLSPQHPVQLRPGHHPLCWTPNQAPPGAGTRAGVFRPSCISLTKNERL